MTISISWEWMVTTAVFGPHPLSLYEKINLHILLKISSVLHSRQTDMRVNKWYNLILGISKLSVLFVGFYIITLVSFICLYFIACLKVRKRLNILNYSLFGGVHFIAYLNLHIIYWFCVLPCKLLSIIKTT